MEKEADANFEKEFLPIWCEGCNQQGHIFVDDPDEPSFVVCSRCGWEASQVWCPKCGMGGDFINERLKDRPISWVCPDCKTEYALPATFYVKPAHLCFEDELPKTTLVRVKPSEKASSKLIAIFLSGIGIAGILVMIFVKSARFPLLILLVILAVMIAFELLDS